MVEWVNKPYEYVSFYESLQDGNPIETFALALIPDGEFVDEKPKPKTYEVEIEGMDGKLDYTEATTGTVKFGNRKLTMPFTAIVDVREQKQWARDVMRKLHGKKFYIARSTDGNVWYHGRVTVDIRAQGRNAKVKIYADCEPYLREWGPTIVSDESETARPQIIDLNGENVAVSPRRVEFWYGTKENPTAKWGIFDAINVLWNPSAATWGGKRYVEIDIASKSESTESYARWQFDRKLGSATITKSMMSQEMIDYNAIYMVRINVQGGQLYGGLTAKALTVDAGAKAVELTTTTTATNAKIIIGGNIYEMPSGESTDENVMLQPGEQVVYTIANAPVELKWHREWL